MVHPEKIFCDLFEAIQLSGLFPDSKTFVDCVPKRTPEAILQAWHREKSRPGFDLKAFVEANFRLPKEQGTAFKADGTRPVSEHISSLWPILTRQPEDQEVGGSLIPLPHPYVVPGGRFGEIYYWDSYFTMLGLQVDGHVDLIRSMVDNFAWLFDEVGFIPNGNRSYFLSRSQPPFFSLMVRLLGEIKGESILLRYLPQLEKEYAFWMNNAEGAGRGEAHRRIVKLPAGEVLNRYFDDDPTPRPESYREDVELAKNASRNAEELWRDLRAACESGWDFSSRWLEKDDDLSSIITTRLIPVDLNCLLLHLEQVLARAQALAGNSAAAEKMTLAAKLRSEAIQKYCWDAAKGWFGDFNFTEGKATGKLTAAAVFPLFFKMASQEQAVAVAENVKAHLLKPGGMLTTPVHSGQQWDAPNGWAPLQWMAIQGLWNYGLHPTADEIRDRWVALNERVYRNTGKLVEKYNVENMDLLAGGGEYPVQDGFGWTNGVLKRLLQEIGIA
ncbi:MAG: trehalase [Saprospirales bacterium]|nr:trehalase [Saprospirales bacterium]